MTTFPIQELASSVERMKSNLRFQWLSVEQCPAVFTWSATTNPLIPTMRRSFRFIDRSPRGTALECFSIDESNFYKHEWLPILRAKNVNPRPLYNTSHSYVSFLYSIGARSGFISSQTGDSIKTLESDYAKYIKDADTTGILSKNRLRKVQP